MRSNPKRSISIGIIGVGAMGKGLIYQSTITQGVRCVAVCDIMVDRCAGFLDMLDIPYRIVNSLQEMHEAIDQGFTAVCADGLLISQCERVDAVIEASSSIINGGRFALAALENRKHLILMNAEIDLAFGPLLMDTAKRNGVVCTSCDGDQYGVLKHLIDDMRLWGFDLVMAGNIKGFLDRYANPTSIIPEADKRNLDYKMCTSYTDGTKLCIEMAITANAYGLRAKIPGMVGPMVAHVQEVFQCFDFESLWADRKPCVDYILGAEPGGGVYAVGYCEHPYQRGMLSYYKMGPGPFYLFYRPYHLCHIEAMDTVTRAVRDGQSLLQPDYGFRTNVYAYAKRDLHCGEMLDGLGGYTCYGLIENCNEQHSSEGIPICLADDVVLKRDIAKDQKILLSDIEFAPERSDFRMFFQSAAISERMQPDK